MHPDAEEIIRRLQLRPHPEGGHYRETFRSPFTVAGPQGAPRAASTAIYFLLPAGEISTLHRVSSDELWHHYGGDPLDLHLLTSEGAHSVIHLGERQPQAVVPAGVWQAAVPAGERYALCGCTVAPGFDFADFELADRDSLVARFPAHRALLERLCRA